MGERPKPFSLSTTPVLPGRGTLTDKRIQKFRRTTYDNRFWVQEVYSRGRRGVSGEPVEEDSCTWLQELSNNHWNDTVFNSFNNSGSSRWQKKTKLSYFEYILLLFLWVGFEFWFVILICLLYTCGACQPRCRFLSSKSSYLRNNSIQYYWITYRVCDTSPRPRGCKNYPCELTEKLTGTAVRA